MLALIIANIALGEVPVDEADNPNLKYIWSVTGIESDPISMVINQADNDLFGQAKYETGLPWNAEVIGSLKGSDVELILTTQIGDELVTTKMLGIFYANETISGTFSQLSGGRMMGNGSFSATWITSDITSYIPAVIDETRPSQPPKLVSSKNQGQSSAQDEKEPRQNQGNADVF